MTAKNLAKEVESDLMATKWVMERLAKLSDEVRDSKDLLEYDKLDIFDKLAACSRCLLEEHARWVRQMAEEERARHG